MDFELKQVSIEDLTANSDFGNYEDMKDDQELRVPVSEDENSSFVFFGPLDFTGKTNSLSIYDWKILMEDRTGYSVDHISTFKKSSDKSKMYAYARATSSIGACDLYAFYPDIFSLLKSLKNFEMLDEEQEMELEAITTVEEAIEFCEENFNHSFFTGLVYGPFEYVSGPKPDENGFAKV